MGNNSAVIRAGMPTDVYRLVLMVCLVEPVSNIIHISFYFVMITARQTDTHTKREGGGKGE